MFAGRENFIKVIEDDEPLEYESGESGSMFDASINHLKANARM